MSITEKRLKELRERLDAAMKDWSNQNPSSNQVWNFFAHAPTDLADLLAEVHRLRDELAKTREVTKDMVERAAEAWYVAQNPGREDWALSAWADMGGSEPSEERSAATLAAHAALTAVLGGGDDA